MRTPCIGSIILAHLFKKRNYLFLFFHLIFLFPRTYYLPIITYTTRFSTPLPNHGSNLTITSICACVAMMGSPRHVLAIMEDVCHERRWRRSIAATVAGRSRCRPTVAERLPSAVAWRWRLSRQRARATARPATRGVSLSPVKAEIRRREVAIAGTRAGAELSVCQSAVRST